MTVSLTNWHKILLQVNPAPDDLAQFHPWICRRNKNEETQIQIVAHGTFIQNQGRTYKKYSFKEIAQTSNEILGKELKNLRENLHAINELLKKERALCEQNIYQGAIDSNAAIKSLNQIGTFYSVKMQYINHIDEVLDNMSQRTEKKYAIQKTKGIWNFIKYFIWYWFWDPTKHIARGKAMIEEISKSEDPIDSWVKTIYDIRILLHKTLCNESTTKQDKAICEEKKNALFRMLNDALKYIPIEKAQKHDDNYHKSIRMVSPHIAQAT